MKLFLFLIALIALSGETHSLNLNKLSGKLQNRLSRTGHQKV